MTLEEPRKTENPSPQALTQSSVTRRAVAVLYDTKQNKLYEVVVDVPKKPLISWVGNTSCSTDAEYVRCQNYSLHT